MSSKNEILVTYTPVIGGASIVLSLPAEQLDDAFAAAEKRLGLVETEDERRHFETVCRNAEQRRKSDLKQTDIAFTRDR